MAEHGADRHDHDHDHAIEPGLEAAGEGLRALALALAWLGISLAVLAVAAAARPPWNGIVLAVAVLAGFIGLVYWWIVPAPPVVAQDSAQGHADDPLGAALALLNAARIWARNGLFIAAAAAIVAVGVADQPRAIKVVMLVGCLGGVGIAAWWARSRFVWHDRPPARLPQYAVIPYNWRFLQRQRQNLLAEMNAVQRANRSVKEEECQLIQDALSAPHWAEQMALLHHVAAAHRRREALIAVHDFIRLSAEDIVTMTERLRRRKRITFLVVLKALAIMVLAPSLFNLWWSWIRRGSQVPAQLK